MSKKKAGFGGGNLGAQKYSARRNMELFKAAVTQARPSAETSSWRAGPPKLYKRVDGRKLLQERYTRAENADLSRKIFDIHHEPRQAATREFAPGWRIGNISGGMCIDCYRTDNPLVKVYHKLHNYKEKCKAQQKRNRHADAQLAKNISTLTSDLAPAVHRKQYAYNRYRARFFLDSKKDNATVLHLGLLREKKGAAAAGVTGATAIAQEEGKTSRQRPASAGVAGRPQAQAQSRQAGAKKGLGLGVNTYTGPQPTARLPRPASAAQYRRGSNLCYALRPAEQPHEQSPLRGGTGAFPPMDTQRLTGPAGEELGRMDDPAESDRLLLLSAAHLRPASASPTRQGHVGSGGQVGAIQRLRSQQPDSAPAVRRPMQQDRQRASEETAVVATAVAQLSSPARQEELRLRAQMQALHCMFPHPYSEGDLELYAGALAAEIESSNRAQEHHEGGVRGQHLRQEHAARQDQAARAYDAQQLGREGSHFRAARSLQQLQPPRRQLDLPISMQQREQWSESPPRVQPKQRDAAIYVSGLVSQRVQAGLPTAKEPVGTTPDLRGSSRRVVASGSSSQPVLPTRVDQEQLEQEQQRGEEEAPAFSLASSPAGLGAFSNVGSHRAMFDRQASATAAAKNSRTGTAVVTSPSRTQHLGRAPAVGEASATLSDARVQVSARHPPPRFPALSAPLSGSASQPCFPSVESNRNIPYSQYPQHSQMAVPVAEAEAGAVVALGSLAASAGVSINAAALSRRSALSAQASAAERASELALLQQTVERLRFKKDLRARQQQKPLSRKGGARQGKLRLHLPEEQGGGSVALAEAPPTSPSHDGAFPVQQHQEEGRSYKKRKLRLLRSSLLLPGSGGAHTDATVFVSDVGVSWAAGADASGAEATPAASSAGPVASSSGVLVEVVPEGDSGCGVPSRVETFVPVRRLRELAEAAGVGALTLQAELVCLVTLDRRAGLFQALADRLSSAAASQLGELVLQALQVRQPAPQGPLELVV